MVRLHSWSLENVEYPFITITLRSTLTWSGSTCEGPIYGSNTTVQTYERLFLILDRIIDVKITILETI